MLHDRSICALPAGASTSVRSARGCLQDTVALVVDDLLCKLNALGICPQGYADDIVIVLRDRFESTVMEIVHILLLWSSVSSWTSIITFNTILKLLRSSVMILKLIMETE